MKMISPFIQEFQYEGQQTRKLLEVVPDDQFSFRPHEKSMTLQGLTSHLIEVLTWVPETCTKDTFVFDMSTYTPFVVASMSEALETYDKLLGAAIETLEGVSDEAYLAEWKMTDPAGTPMFPPMPRAAVLRSMIMNHQIHHRGQLTVYLRMVGAKLPGLYGPSADEEPAPAA